MADKSPKTTTDAPNVDPAQTPDTTDKASDAPTGRQSKYKGGPIPRKGEK
jgi:hypothetical protein